MRRLRICAATIVCLGCGEPLVVPVDIALGDATVAHPPGDGATETEAGPPAANRLDGGVVDAATVEPAPGDAAPGDALTSPSPRCITLADPVLSARRADGAAVLTPSAADVVAARNDDELACDVPVDAGPSLEENPNLDASAGSTTKLHANYERVDSAPIVVGGRSYALAIPADTNPLGLNVLFAKVLAGDAPCEEREQLGSIATLPLGGGDCIDLTPPRDARFLRLPIEMSNLLASTPLTLCQATCAELGL